MMEYSWSSNLYADLIKIEQWHAETGIHGIAYSIDRLHSVWNSLVESFLSESTA
jgi:hypothetical protein